MTQNDVAPSSNRHPDLLTHLALKAIRFFASLPTSIQWTILTILKSILASSILSLLAIYATAAFAIRNGFRVPVENTPFIQFAIALGTFVSFAGTIATFTLLIVIIDNIETQFEMGFRLLRKTIGTLKPVSYKSRSRAVKTIEIAQWATKTIFGSRFTLLIALLGFVSSAATLIFPKTFTYLAIPGSSFIGPIDFAGKMFLASICTLAIWCVTNELTWIAAQAFAALIILLFMVIGLFTNDVYGSFLRIVRFGGGIEASLTFVTNDKGQEQAIVGNLLILTTTHAILLEKERHDIVEIPSKNITMFRYSSDPAWELPNYITTKQLKYIDLDIIHGTRSP
ncbi:hypothetical protein RPPS3_36070 [Rhodopseudomonas palustris]|uniref:hypothetical protein n=1 Tax=Rhodopseudomonas palustris TaxID=1076 RepID=UPI000D227E2B|nr:hypothetical protein [Rhodopseudomonas palustris]AVT77669.1 hypothetical protein RPPS3_36070 [Rhodopseudomonas palustris]